MSVHEFKSASPSLARGGDDGGNISDRLRQVEITLEGIREQMKTVATREWILWRVLMLLLSAIGLSATLATAITFSLIRMFG